MEEQKMWIARDSDGELNMFCNRPERRYPFMEIYEEGWWFEGTFTQQMQIDPALFPELRWEDEPIEVELIRKSKSHEPV